MTTDNVGRKKLPTRFRVKRYMSKTKGERFELHSRDYGYIATLGSEDEVGRRIAMEQARHRGQYK